MKKGSKMNKFTKLAIAAIVGMSSVVANAGEITVGGVSWDPDFDDGFSMDFGATTSFQQWFTTSSTIGTEEIVLATADNAVNAGTAGSELVGVGEFNLLNGLDNTGFLCAGCELTFAFGGIVLGAGGFDVTNSWIKLFSDSSADFVTSVGDFVDAQDGQLWLDGAFDSFILTSGTISNGFAEGLISVDAGLAFANFDTDGQPIGMGGSDLKLSSSANFLNDPVFSNVASADVVGNTVRVPAPGTLAIFGLGLIGLGASARRRKSL
jgi:hypothetical protein